MCLRFFTGTLELDWDYLELGDIGIKLKIAQVNQRMDMHYKEWN
jgi:hypothetical protein